MTPKAHNCLSGAKLRFPQNFNEVFHRGVDLRDKMSLSAHCGKDGLNCPTGVSLSTAEIVFLLSFYVALVQALQSYPYGHRVQQFSPAVVIRWG